MKLRNRIWHRIRNKFYTYGIIIFLFFISATCSNKSGLQESGQSIRNYAFLEVNVISMDREGILRNQTVITENDRIITIGPSESVQIPSEAIPIDSRGKYLMPGLSDMHVHTWEENDMILYIANGVTTIRIMAGSTWHLKLREKIVQGELPGPRIYLCGDFLDSSPAMSEVYHIIDDPGDVTDVIRDQKEAGYDFSGISKPHGDVKYYSLAYAEFVVPLVKAVQEQQERIDNGQLKIDNYEKRIAEQDLKIKAYESRLSAVEQEKAALNASLSELLERVEVLEKR